MSEICHSYTIDHSVPKIVKEKNLLPDCKTLYFKGKSTLSPHRLPSFLFVPSTKEKAISMKAVILKFFLSYFFCVYFFILKNCSK